MKTQSLEGRWVQKTQHGFTHHTSLVSVGRAELGHTDLRDTAIPNIFVSFGGFYGYHIGQTWQKTTLIVGNPT